MTEFLIYIRVSGRDPECWAPANAVPLSADIYRVTRVLSEDALEFKVGDQVRVEERGFPDGSQALLAIEPAGSA